MLPSYIQKADVPFSRMHFLDRSTQTIFQVQISWLYTAARDAKLGDFNVCLLISQQYTDSAVPLGVCTATTTSWAFTTQTEHKDISVAML